MRALKYKKNQRKIIKNIKYTFISKELKFLLFFINIDR